MRKILLCAGLAAGVMWCQDASAAPAIGNVVREAATANSPIEQAQFAERRTRHGIVKCYRDLVIGPYRCHHYSGPL
jgi:hypothetical protein